MSSEEMIQNFLKELPVALSTLVPHPICHIYS